MTGKHRAPKRRIRPVRTILSTLRALLTRPGAAR
jgi:hypothetical protein